jgi:hypothetical protein
VNIYRRFSCLFICKMLFDRFCTVEKSEFSSICTLFMMMLTCGC